MILNVISLIELFTITYPSICINEFKIIAVPSQLFWPQNCGCYITNYFEWTSTVIDIKKKQLLTHVQIFMNNIDVNSDRYG